MEHFQIPRFWFDCNNCRIGKTPFEPARGRSDIRARVYNYRLVFALKNCAVAIHYSFVGGRCFGVVYLFPKNLAHRFSVALSNSEVHCPNAWHIHDCLRATGQSCNVPQEKLRPELDHVTDISLKSFPYTYLIDWCPLCHDSALSCRQHHVIVGTAVSLRREAIVPARSLPSEINSTVNNTRYR